VEFLPNFVHVENFTPCYDFLDYFVYVGRLSAEKGLFTLLKAMKTVHGPRLKIIGRGPLEIPLKKFAAENNLTHVEFTGFLSGEDLVSAISKAMFVVMPSEWYENCPMVLLEAFALGTPAIGSDLGGIPGLIQDGRNGFVFTPGDADDLAEKINLLAKNPGLIRTFSQESRKKVENTYNAEVHYQRLMSIYEKAINRF
jgi:glycosyltransferase involved in cell wall biosynthesis